MGSRQSSVAAEQLVQVGPASASNDKSKSALPPTQTPIVNFDKAIERDLQGYSSTVPYGDTENRPSRVGFVTATRRYGHATRLRRSRSLPVRKPLHVVAPPASTVELEDTSLSSDAATRGSEAEIAAWTQYLDRLRQVNNDRIEAREKRKTSKANRHRLQHQHRDFSLALRQFQKTGGMDSMLNKQLLQMSYRILKAQEELEASELEAGETEDTLIQAEFLLDLSAPTFVSKEQLPEDSYSLLRKHGFDFPGYRSEAQNTRDLELEEVSSLRGADQFVTTKLARILSIEQEIIDLRAETAALVERKVVSQETSPEDDARLDAFDAEERTLLTRLGDAALDFDRNRDTQDTQDATSDTPVVTTRHATLTTTITGPVDALTLSPTLISEFVDIIHSKSSYVSLTEYIDRLRHRDSVPIAQELVNCWLLYQLGNISTEPQQYLAIMAAHLDRFPSPKKVTQALDQLEDDPADGPSTNQYASLRPDSDASRHNNDHKTHHSLVEGPTFADSLSNSLQQPHLMLHKWFHDGTSPAEPESPIETIRYMSTNANAEGSRGVLSGSISNVSRGPLRQSRDLKSLTQLPSRISEILQSPPLSAQGGEDALPDT